MLPSSLKPARTWPYVTAGWLLILLISASSTIGGWILNGRNFPLGVILLLELPRWLTFAILTPLIFYLGRRFPIQRPRLAAPLGLHLAAATTISALLAVDTSTRMAVKLMSVKAIFAHPRL